MKNAPIPKRHKTVFFRVTDAEYAAVAKAARERNMLLSVWLRRVIQQKLGIEETV